MTVPNRPLLPHAFADDPAEQWEFDLFTVFNGGAEKARLGRVPRFLAKALGSSTTIVYVHTTAIKKVRGKHKITFQEVCELATVFAEGNAARDSRSDLAFWYSSPNNPRRIIKAVVKTTRQRHELWLKTMHPINKHRVDALKKKALILRDAK